MEKMKKNNSFLMKKMAAFVLLLSIIALSALSGCTTIIQKNPAGQNDASTENDLDDGEVYYQFTANPEPCESRTPQVADLPETCQLSESKIAELCSNADDVIAQYPDFSGTVLLSSGNKIIYEKSYGRTGVRKDLNHNDTYYQVGSITKQFTGTAVMNLIKEGKLGTSDTLDKYFPEYDYDYMKTITIGHLLEMSAGMGDYMDLIEGDETKLKGYMTAAKKSEDDAKRFIVDTILEYGIDTEPGKVYAYSNSAYYLLGMIIEQLSGMPYREYLQKNFFDPSGMTDTYFVGDGKDSATGYSPAQLKFVSDKDSKDRAAEGDYPYLFSAGSVVSTVEDINKWLTIVNTDRIFTSSDRKVIEKSLMLYNYGWNTSDGLWHHSGRTYAYSSQVYADYKTDTTMVILTNVSFYSELGDISMKVYLPLVSAVKETKK